MKPLVNIPFLAFVSLAAAGLVFYGPGASSTIAAEEAARETSVTAPQLLPASTVLYAEIARPKRLLATLLDHPIRMDLEKKEPYQKALREPGYRKFRTVVSLFEDKIGEDWRTVVESVTAGGVSIAVDAETKGVAIIARSSDAQLLTKTLDTFVFFARLEAQNKGQPDPIRTSTYRDVQAYRAGNARFATIGPWLVVANNEDLGKQIVDRLLDLPSGGEKADAAGRDRLAGNTEFQNARAATTGEPAAWGFVNVAFLREAGVAKKLFAGKTDNPLAELLVGGLLDTLGKTDYATAALDVTSDHMAVSLAVPHDSAWTTDARQYYFGPKGAGAAPGLLTPSQTLASLGTFRDLPAMWAASDDLYEERVSAKVAQADSNLSTLFSGRDFGREILGAVGPQLSLVVARQQFDESRQPVPDIKLPAAAALLHLKDAKITRQLKVSFQSLIGLVNFGQAQKGLPQFELNTETLGKSQLISAVYLADDPVDPIPSDNQDADSGNDNEPADQRPGIIQYNLTPAIGIVGDNLIISTSRALAKELLDSAAAGAQATKPVDTEAANTHAMVDISALRTVLRDNRDHFIAQNMLEKGHDRQQAEGEIDTLFDLLGYLKRASLRLVVGADKLELKLDVALNEL